MHQSPEGERDEQHTAYDLMRAPGAEGLAAGYAEWLRQDDERRRDAHRARHVETFTPLQPLAPHRERTVNAAGQRRHAIQHLQVALRQAHREQRRAQETEARAQRAIRRAEAVLAEGE